MHQIVANMMLFQYLQVLKIRYIMKDSYIILPAFSLGRGQTNIKIIGLPCPIEI